MASAMPFTPLQRAATIIFATDDAHYDVAYLCHERQR